MHIVGRDHHGGAQPVERFEQADELERHFGIDVSGRLVSHQHVGPSDYRASNRDTLLLAARKSGGPRIGPLREPDPFQHVGNRRLQICFAHAGNAQGQGDIVEGGQMVDQAEVLEHHAHAPAIGGQTIARQRDHIGAEHPDRPARGTLGEIEQLEQRRLAGPAGSCEKIETAWKQSERYVGQHFAIGTVTQADIVELHDLIFGHAHCPASGIKRKGAPAIVANSL